MAAGNFQRCLNVTLPLEGGWSDNPADPGGATMKGITIGTFRRFHPKATKADLKAISNDNVATIYRTDYWGPINGESLAAGVDLATFDASVNSGVGRGKAWLAASVGGSPADTVKKLCAKRLGFMQSLRIWKTFGKGWARRVADIEAKGVAWAIAIPGNAAVVKAVLEREADDAGKKAGKQATGAGGAIVSAPVGNSAIDTGHTLILFLVLVAAIAGILIWRAHINKTRAAAYIAEAAAQ